MDKTRNELTCQICLLILNQPVLLPCKCLSPSSICKTHLTQTEFECRKCQTKLNLNLIEPKYDEQILYKLEQYHYLPHKQREIKLSLDAKVKRVKDNLDKEKEVSQNANTLKIADHFYDLRNQIDIVRETVLNELLKNSNEDTKLTPRIEEIQLLSEDFIEKIKQVEENFRKNYVLEIDSHLNETHRSLDEEIKKIEIAIRASDIPTDENMKQLTSECELMVKENTSM